MPKVINLPQDLPLNDAEQAIADKEKLDLKAHREEVIGNLELIVKFLRRLLVHQSRITGLDEEVNHEAYD